MNRLPLRRLLVGVIAACAFVALPAAGSARTSGHPEGPNCELAPGNAGMQFLTESVRKGVPLTFLCEYYKNDRLINYYEPNTGTSSKDSEPLVPKFDGKGTISVSSRVQHFLHLPSRVLASGDMAGPQSGRVRGYPGHLDVYRLRFKASVLKRFKSRRVAWVNSDIRVTLQSRPAEAVYYPEGSPVAVHVPGNTQHLDYADQTGEHFVISNSAFAPCTHFLTGDGTSFGCAGGVHR